MAIPSLVALVKGTEQGDTAVPWISLRKGSQLSGDGCELGRLLEGRYRGVPSRVGEGRAGSRLRLVRSVGRHQTACLDRRRASQKS